MKAYLKNSFIFLLIFATANIHSLQAALYTPEQQKLLISRLDHLVAYQQHLFKILPAESRLTQSFHRVNLEMVNMPEEESNVLVKIIDNCFILKLFPKIEEFLVSEFLRQGIGKPYLSYLALNEPMEISVVSSDPTKDAHLDQSSSESKVVSVFESSEGIQHFDQQFRTYIYRIAFDRGMMVKRGRYLYVDSDLNGVPDSLYFLNKYCDGKRKYHHYAKLISSGERVIKGTAYYERYRDALFMVMDYIVTNFPFERYEIHEDYAQAL